MAGKYKQNIKKIEGYFYHTSSIDFYKQYKFCIAFENTDEKYYITEKVLIPIISGSIPIYSGTTKVNKYFNKDRFINVKDFNDYKKLISYLRNMSDEEWLMKVNSPILKIPYNVILKKIIKKTHKICKFDT